jgi:hypothetical protein
MVEVSLPKTEGDDGLYYRGKIATARFFITRILPQTNAHAAAIMAGAKPIMELEDAAF